MLHTWSIPQVTPQDPQLAAFAVSEVSQPSEATRLQSPKPGEHAPMPHDPLVHVCVATFGRAHTRPHPPQ